MTMLPLAALFAALAAFAQDTAPQAAAPAPAPAAADPAMSEPLSIEDSLQLRDPFRRPLKYADPSNSLALPELERFSVDQFKVVGIITGPKKAKALITTPANKMHIVQENDKIGVHKGFIKKIKEKSILVRERVVNLLGQEESTDTEIFYVGSGTKAEAKGGVPGVQPPGGADQQLPDNRRL